MKNIFAYGDRYGCSLLGNPLKGISKYNCQDWINEVLLKYESLSENK